jgi:hypothetical protein
MKSTYERHYLLENFLLNLLAVRVLQKFKHFLLLISYPFGSIAFLVVLVNIPRNLCCENS